ncbi:MAG: SDR family oxidoreductase [Clostridiales bacterium]|nr:SDR family oxidoreductase [Clostridiales bacterium]
MDGLRFKRALVTGATSGIGFVTARELARMGADVVVHARTQRRGEAARDLIAEQTGTDRVEVLVADFTDLFAVCAAANEYVHRYDRLDILVLNAAVINPQRLISEHGNELTFQVNHLAHFMLWRVLQPLMWASSPSRVVHVSSDAHYAARRGIRFDDLTLRDGWNPFAAYAHSKLAGIMWCYEQARRLAPMGVTCNAVHPGMTGTGLAVRGYGAWGRVIGALSPLTARSVQEAAETVIWLAASPDVEGVTGGYFFNGRHHRSSAASRDEQEQARLWELSRELSGCGCLTCPQ